MVSFQDQVIGLADITQHLLREMPHISHQAKGNPLAPYLVSHVVRTVMGHGKGGDLKLTHLKLHSLLYQPHPGRIDFFLHAIVALYTIMHLAGGIHRQGQARAQRTYGLHVVSVVVGDQDVPRLLQGYPVSVEVFLQRPDPHSGVYHQRVSASVEIIAVAATSTAKGYKLEHISFYFAQKYQKNPSRPRFSHYL